MKFLKKDMMLKIFVAVFFLSAILFLVAESTTTSATPPTTWNPTYSLNLSGGNWVDCGDRTELNGVRDLTISFTIFKRGTGWFSGARTIVGRSATGKKQFLIQARPSSSGYDLSVCFADNPTGPSSSLKCRYVSAGTLIGGRKFNQITVVKQGTDIKVALDGEYVPVTGTDSIPEYLTSVTGVPLTWGGSDLLQESLHSGAIWIGRALKLPDIRRFQGPAVGSGDIAPLNPTWWWPLGTGDTLPTVSPRVGDVSCQVTPGTGTLLDRIPETRILPPDDMASYRFRVRTGKEAGEPRAYTGLGGAVKLSEGDILGCYARGNSHLAEDQDMFIVRSHTNGRTWPYSGKKWPGEYETEQLLFDAVPTHSSRGCSLSQLSNGRIIAILNDRPEEPTGMYPERQILTMYSDDNGKTWSEPSEMVNYGTQWASAGGGHVVERSDGCISFGFYWRNLGEGRYTSSMATSCDHGESWETTATIAQDTNSINGRQFEEPVCGKLNDGRWMCLIRVDSTKDILASWSTDEGRTWSAPVFAFDGWNWPAWIQLEGTNTIVALTRNSVAPYRGTVTWSSDNGATWAVPVEYQSADGGTNVGHAPIEISPGIVGVWNSQEVGTSARQDWTVLRPLWETS